VNTIHDMQEMKRKADPTLSPAPTARFLIQGRRGTEGLPTVASEFLAPLRARVQQGTDWEQVSKELLLQLAKHQDKVN
jgi:hypothetical protein